MPEEEADFEKEVEQQRKEMGSSKKKQKDTARLVWASKPRKEPSAKDLVFQTAEEVYPNKATGGGLSGYLDKGQRDISKNPNRLIWGDNLLVMQALLAHGYEGQIDLIYIDPPFNTGKSFNFTNKISLGGTEFEKELSMNEQLAYTDTWWRGLDSFLDMMLPRLQLMNRLLSVNGSIYVHTDWHAGHYVKVLMDEIFGRKNFRNEIIWYYYNKMQGNIDRFASNHDVIFYYSKTDSYMFQKQSELREKAVQQLKRIWDKKTGKLMNAKDENGKVIYNERTERTVDDVWRLSMLQPADTTENLSFQTQKPETLVERIIRTSSNENSLVADFFCGSGTTAAVAERLGRRWITTDLSKTAIQVARARLVNQDANPFVVENLGNYQRQLVYMHEVKLREMYNIVLRLYGATPREDKLGVGISTTDRSTLVYVCEPDRPMTAKKALDLAKEAYTLDGKGYRHLAILAWDYEWNYDEDLRKLTANLKGSTTDIQSKIIPSDVYRYLKSSPSAAGIDSGKIIFYEKPYLKVPMPETTDMGDEALVKLKLEQYIIKDNPIKDEEKRQEVEALLRKNYAYLIDFWAVDWDYDGETFRSRWQAIRDRRSGEPVVTTADFRLKKGKKYKIALRVVDVFGNDASVVKELNLR